MQKIKINTFGEGIEVRHIVLDDDRYQQWSEIAARKNQKISDLLLDPFFFHQLKDPNVRSITDLNSKLISGILDRPKSQIEIWFNRHKVLKLKPNELFNEMLLFPLFQIEKDNIIKDKSLEKGFYVIQKTMGLLNSVQLKVDCRNLNLDDFTFSLSEFQDEQFLSQIMYQKKHFDFIKSDNVITYQTSLEIT